MSAVEVRSRNVTAQSRGEHRPQSAAQKKWTLARLIETSPEDAMQWVSENLEGQQERRDAISQILQAWADEDPYAAWHGAGEVADPILAKQHQLDVGYYLSTTDPQITLQLASNLPPSREGLQLMQDAAMRWAMESPNMALEWCGAHPDTEVSDALIASIASYTGSVAPEQTAQIIKMIQPGVLFDRAAYQLALYWLAHEPDACQHWAKSLPESAARRQIFSLIEDTQ